MSVVELGSPSFGWGFVCRAVPGRGRVGVPFGVALRRAGAVWHPSGHPGGGGAGDPDQPTPTTERPAAGLATSRQGPWWCGFGSGP